MMVSHCRIFRLGFVVALALAAAGAVGAEDPLAPYPSPAMRAAEVSKLHEAHAERVEVLEYGRSGEGEPLVAMRVHRPGPEKKPAAWFGACIHGNEWIGNRVVMAIAVTLLGDDGRDPLVTRAMEEMDFFIAPCLNPDGYRRTWDDPHEPGEDAAGARRKNTDGVDLNRNWPIPGEVTIPIDWAGSPDPDSIRYRGPSPLSEPETAALDRFFREHDNIVAGISFHSTAGVMFPPHCPSHACVVRSKKMGRAFRSEQVDRPYPRLQSRWFDTYTGELEDWLYAEYGVLAMDVEVSTSGANQKACHCKDPFWTFNPVNPDYWTTNDARAAIAAVVEANRVLDGRRLPPEER